MRSERNQFCYCTGNGLIDLQYVSIEHKGFSLFHSFYWVVYWNKIMYLNLNRQFLLKHALFLYIKGKVAWDFCPLVLFSNRPRLAPCLLYYIFFEFCIEFAELFEFEIRTVQWATAGNQIFLANTRDLKLGWCRPSVLLFIDIHFFGITVPLKDKASF
jgi:hypothetical protein